MASPHISTIFVFHLISTSFLIDFSLSGFSKKYNPYHVCYNLMHYNFISVLSQGSRSKEKEETGKKEWVKTKAPFSDVYHLLSLKWS